MKQKRYSGHAGRQQKPAKFNVYWGQKIFKAVQFGLNTTNASPGKVYPQYANSTVVIKMV